MRDQVLQTLLFQRPGDTIKCSLRSLPFEKVPVQNLWFWYPTGCLHLNLGVELVDLLSEVVLEVGALGFEGGSEEAVLH